MACGIEFAKEIQTLGTGVRRAYSAKNSGQRSAMSIETLRNFSGILAISFSASVNPSKHKVAGGSYPCNPAVGCHAAIPPFFSEVPDYGFAFFYLLAYPSLAAPHGSSWLVHRTHIRYSIVLISRLYDRYRLAR